MRIRNPCGSRSTDLIQIRIITSGSGSNHQFVFTANFHMKQKKDINISALGLLCVNENLLEVLVKFWSKKIRFFYFKFEVGTDLSQQYLEDRAGSESKSCHTKKLSKTILYQVPVFLKCPRLSALVLAVPYLEHFHFLKHKCTVKIFLKQFKYKISIVIRCCYLYELKFLTCC